MSYEVLQSFADTDNIVGKCCKKIQIIIGMIGLFCFLISEIEEQVRHIQNKKKSLGAGALTAEEEETIRVGLGSQGHFDTDIYSSGKSKFFGYVTSIATTDDKEVYLFYCLINFTGYYC